MHFRSPRLQVTTLQRDPGARIDTHTPAETIAVLRQTRGLWWKHSRRLWNGPAHPAGIQRVAHKPWAPVHGVPQLQLPTQAISEARIC